jgi:hypothetical protein
VTHNAEHIIVHKNRKRAIAALAIVAFFIPISVWFMFLGLQPGRPDVSWVMVLFGAVGLVAFAASAVSTIRTMRAPWHLALTPGCLTLYTSAYDLPVPWERVVGIAVDDVNRKPGCILIFDDVAAIARGATFHGSPAQEVAITDAAAMRARMQENYDELGYHLGIPGRLLEKGPEELAELLAKARTGQLWEGEEA